MNTRHVGPWWLFLPLLLVALLTTPLAAQEGAITGTVTDAVTGVGLSAVQVEVRDASQAVVTGAFSSTGGAFRLTGIPAGSYSVSFTLPGWELVVESGVVVSAGQSTSLSVTLAERSFNLNPITVTTSKRVEKALDAPAAVEVVSRQDIAERPVASASEHVKEKAGVDFVNTGLQSNYVVVRGFNNIFSGATLNLTDNRISRVPSLRVNISHLNPTTNADIERVEVVLGPGSALYGPNAANGVIHYLTQSPIDYPGVNLSFASGLRHQGDTSDGADASTEVTWHGEGRLAWANEDETFGIKISGQYFTGTDYLFNDPEELRLQGLAANCIAAGFNPQLPDCFNFAGDLPGLVDPVSGFALPPALADPDDLAALQTRVTNVADGRDNDVKRWALDLRTDFRPSPETSIVLAGGRTAAVSSVDLTGIGAGQVVNWAYWYAQGRFTWKRLFAQLFWNRNANDETYLLRSGRPLVDNSYQLVGQLQHASDLGEDHTLTYGVDLLYTNPKSEGTINGRHEDDDDVTEYGGYVQYDGHFTDQWNLVLAARLDDHSRLADPVFSPRAALVFKPTPERSLRLSYNRAFSTPNTLNYFLDISAQAISISGPFFYEGRAQGVTENGFTFDRDGNGVPRHMSPFNPLVCQTTPQACQGQLGQEDAFTPRYRLPSTTEQVWSEAVAVIGASRPEFAPLLTEQILSLAGLPPVPTAADIPVIAATLDPESQTFINPVLDLRQVQDVPTLEPTIWQTIELGYKGLLLEDKLLLGANVYYTDVTDFVSALRAFTPNIFLPEESIRAFLEARYLPLVGVAFASEAEARAAAAGLANGMAQVPLGVLVPETAGGTTAAPILFTYQNLGDFNFFGADASLTYVLNDRWELSGSISWVEKNAFDAGEELVPLNAPKWKGAVTLGYRQPGESGWNGAIRGRFVDGFPIASGVYATPIIDAATGEREEIPGYSVFDLNIGYRFPGTTRLTAQLEIQNIFDNDYQSFVGVPEFGRYALLRLVWNY